jgi:lipopolysaccharide transport system ATP-binding protein
MGELAISVEGLGKRFRIGEQQPSYRTFREMISGAALAPVRGLRALARGRGGDRRAGGRAFWALKDISFEVRPGEVLGIIGRNGAGKSTLLKILTRITEPTEGAAEIWGRVGSLLEVGTGFHPELTGRENVYLNGAILGMKRTEIARKFDEIVAFAEVERFIDTPVKRYSSGMHVRLAFAVAAHLEPDVLIVDEVLAVGDAAFQKKCLGKIGTVAREGRTVLFVSHDMTNVAMLCDSVLLLNAGRVEMRGPTAEAVEMYMQRGDLHQPVASWDAESAPGDGVARIVAVSVLGGAASSALQGTVELAMEFLVLSGKPRLNPGFTVRNALGTSVFATANYEEQRWGAREYRPGRYRTRCLVPPHLLNDGLYTVDAYLVEQLRSIRAEARGAVAFRVYDDGSTRGEYVGAWEGVVRPRCRWTTESAERAPLERCC